MAVKDPRSDDAPISRKRFLAEGASGLASAAGALLLSTALGRLAFADEPGAGADTLVCVYLRGGCDGLNLVVPIEGEDRAIYEAERPSIKIAATGNDAALALDARFGLHPSARLLKELYDHKSLALIPAAGLTADTRSHFDAQAMMEAGTPGRKTTPTGWLARHLGATTGVAGSGSFLSAVSVGTLVPGSLAGYPGVAVIGNLQGFNLGGNANVNAQRKVLRAMYSSDGAAASQSWLMRYGRETLDALDALETGDKSEYKPSNGADYGKSDIGNKLKTTAQLIRTQLGLRVAAVDMGGWDTHKYQGQGTGGQFSNLVGQLSQALHAFNTDLADTREGKALTVVVMTEFGRRVKENASHGTDHGHGGVMMVLGPSVNGGKVYGDWPGLKTESLYERADVAVTTDYREVLAEVVGKRLRDKRLDVIFPGFTPKKSLGLLRS